MDQQQWHKVNTIVDAALELEREKRVSFIEEECEGNKKLKLKVTELLASIEESSEQDFLDNNTFFHNWADDPEQPANEQSASALIGEEVGNYTIRELIDHGGMGSVFLAERSDETYKGKVALKVLRRGMDTPSNISRFKRERNILAKLHHPNIARLLDGGVTRDNLPYLVMEYVEGQPLIDYCEAKRLSIDKRLELFETICRAVRHAHKNAVIHRDLKPSNILVTEDGKVKILDFGIAKLTEPIDSLGTMFQTKTGTRMLTLGYAAPEQLTSEAVTTATDTYTLGILLYELLAGVHPLDINEKKWIEAEQLIKEKTPAYPSTKLAGFASEQETLIANQRKMTASALIKTLRGDLDAIILKALRKEPDHRYPTVEALLEDLKHYREARPVKARSGSWRYYAGKFVRRHRWGVGAAAASLLLIAGFIAMMLWQIKKTARQRDRAVSTSTFMKNILSISDPEKGQGGAMPVRALLQEGAARLDTSFKDNPSLKADLEDVIGSAFRGYGLYEEALGLLRKALTLRISENGPNSLPVAETRNAMGEVFYYRGRQDSAAAYYHKALEIRRRLLGTHHVEIAQSLNNLGLLDLFHENYPRAAKRMKKALVIFQDHLGPDHWRIANVLNNLAGVRSAQGELPKAEKLYRRAMAMHIRVKGQNHRDVARAEAHLGGVLVREGELAIADTTFKGALQRSRASTTNNLPIIGEILVGFGDIRLRQGHYAEAESYYRKAHALFLKALPPGHKRQATAILGLGKAFLAQGHTQKALEQARKAVSIDEGALPPGQRRLAEKRCFLGAVLVAAKRYKEAEDQLLESRKVLAKPTYPAAERARLKVDERLAQLYESWGKPNQTSKYRIQPAAQKKTLAGPYH